MKFIAGWELSLQAKEILAGNKLSCAVAFWGSGAKELLMHAHTDSSQIRIICDLRLGGTNPFELEKIFEDIPNGIRQLKAPNILHAKVYISDVGALIGSANVSKFGLGDAGSGSYLEAAIFFPPNSEMWNAAKSWFDELWTSNKRTTPIGKREIKNAQATWRPALQSGYRGAGETKKQYQPVRGSLISRIIGEPEKFDTVSFVVCGNPILEEQRKDAIRSKIKHSQDLEKSEIAKIRTWPKNNMFADWERKEVKNWKKDFILIYKSSVSAKYYFYERAYEDVEAGAVFAKKQAKKMLHELEIPYTIESMAEIDQTFLTQLAKSLIAEDGALARLFPDATSFRQYLVDKVVS